MESNFIKFKMLKIILTCVLFCFVLLLSFLFKLVLHKIITKVSSLAFTTSRPCKVNGHTYIHIHLQLTLEELNFLTRPRRVNERHVCETAPKSIQTMLCLRRENVMSMAGERGGTERYSSSGKRSMVMAGARGVRVLGVTLIIGWSGLGKCKRKLSLFVPPFHIVLLPKCYSNNNRKEGCVVWGLVL